MDEREKDGSGPPPEGLDLQDAYVGHFQDWWGSVGGKGRLVRGRDGGTYTYLALDLRDGRWEPVGESVLRCKCVKGERGRGREGWNVGEVGMLRKMEVMMENSVESGSWWKKAT